MIKRSPSIGNEVFQAKENSEYDILGVERPIGNESEPVESILGIKTQIIENVKLCGLRKARETAIMDLIGLLCNQVSKKDNDAKKWMKFGDEIACVAAKKLIKCNHYLEESTKLRKASYEQARQLHKVAKGIRVAMTSIAADAAKKVQSTCAIIIEEIIIRLRKEVQLRVDEEKSKFAHHMQHEMSTLTKAHEKEKQLMEKKIHSLQDTTRLREKELEDSQTQLYQASCQWENEKTRSASMESRFETEKRTLLGQLSEARDEIYRLKEELKAERLERAKDADATEQKITRELDAIESKVNYIIKLKNEEVERAMRRMHTAEASAEESKKVLFELKNSVSPYIVREGPGHNASLD